MSKLILNALKTIKPLIKGNGLTIEKYGLIEDGILYFNNGIIEIEMPVDIPFNACINLYELITVLDKLKGETVIVYQDDVVEVIYEDRHYNISVYSFNAMKTQLHQFKLQPQVSCPAPQVFKQMCKIAETYVQPIRDITSIAYTHETMLICDNAVICSDKFNVIQAMLDFGMPNGAYTLDSIVAFRKIAKGDIVGMAMNDTHLMLLLDNGLKIYLKNLFNDLAKLHYEKVLTALNKVWEMPTITLPDHIKTQLEMVHKVSLQNVVFFNNTFCQAGDTKIEYASFTDENFTFKCLYKHLLVVSANSNLVKFSEKGLSFISQDNLLRGFIGRILSDER